MPFNGLPFEIDSEYDSELAREFGKHLRDEVVGLADTKVISEGHSGSGPWHTIAYQFAAGSDFNRHPHITISVRAEDARIQLTLPNKAESAYWKRLIEASDADLMLVMCEMAEIARPLRRNIGKNVWEPKFTIHAHQRHYYTANDKFPLVDGEAILDWDLFLPDKLRVVHAVKSVPEWFTTFVSALRASRRAGTNIELQLGARYSYRIASSARHPDFAMELAACIPVFQPFVEFLRS